MSKHSRIAELGMIEILHQMKNPLTNIRLCLEMMEKNKQTEMDREVYCAIMKSSAIRLEDTIRDLCFSFDSLGVSLYVEEDTTPI